MFEFWQMGTYCIKCAFFSDIYTLFFEGGFIAKKSVFLKTNDYCLT